MMFGISVVIPCYNGWKHMSRCLESLEKQTRQFNEIIIVDDCSADETHSELLTYISKSKLNIKLLKNEKNVGPGKSREYGIEAATNDYVAFCDCDDWYELDFLEKIEKEIKCSAPDIVIFDNFTVFSDGRKRIDHITTPLIGMDKNFILANYEMSLCRLIVKKDLFKGVCHSELRHAEDGVVAIQLLAAASQIKVLDIPFYNYYFRSDSISKKPSKKTSGELCKAFDLIYDLISANYSDEVEFVGVKYVCYGAVLTGAKANLSKKELKKHLRNFEMRFPKWYDNKYICGLGKIKRMFLMFVKYKMLLLVYLLSKMHPLLAMISRGE